MQPAKRSRTTLRAYQTFESVYTIDPYSNIFDRFGTNPWEFIPQPEHTKHKDLVYQLAQLLRHFGCLLSRSRKYEHLKTCPGLPMDAGGWFMVLHNITWYLRAHSYQAAWKTYYSVDLPVKQG